VKWGFDADASGYEAETLMVTAAKVKRGSYFDSVTLMKIAREMTAIAGVADAAAVMGTEENLRILVASGLAAPEFAGASGTDLLLAVKADHEVTATSAMAAAERLLESTRKRVRAEAPFRPASIDGALEVIPDANLALISVAGRYAGELARQALERGLHVMIFSDNVPLATEVALKRFAASRGLLVMGPDCGTAIVNGVPLGFANAVNRGAIGIVAASGTGLQEVSSIVSVGSTGVSQAIGTGGRDVRAEVGGVMFLAGITALAEDPETRVIVLVSKPPDESVRAAIDAAISLVEKPVVSVFLGSEPRRPHDVRTLEEAAMLAVALAQGVGVSEVSRFLESREEDFASLAGHFAERATGRRRYVRALMSGGTFAAEAQVVFRRCGVRDVTSNVPTAGATTLEDALRSTRNAVVDLGANEFTVGRPHPMIDYSLRKKRIIEEARDPETAVILLDVVLGYGSNPDPLSELDNVIRRVSRDVAVITSATGTDRDPQDRSAVVQGLRAAGAFVAPSNAAASKLAGDTVRIIQCR
jgi:FdrA protein